MKETLREMERKRATFIPILDIRDGGDARGMLGILRFLVS